MNASSNKTIEGAKATKKPPKLRFDPSFLQRAILSSANFSSIATDAKGVIQIFNIGAEKMLGYTSAEVTNKISPADICDPQEIVTRAKTLSARWGCTSSQGSMRCRSKHRAGSKTSTS